MVPWNTSRCVCGAGGMFMGGGPMDTVTVSTIKQLKLFSILFIGCLINSHVGPRDLWQEVWGVLMAKLQNSNAEERMIILQIYLWLIIIGRECYSLLIKSH